MKANQAMLVAFLAMGFFTFNSGHAQSLERNKAVLMRAENEVWSKGNLAAADGIYAPDFVCHFIDGIEWRGIDGLKAAVASHRSSFPDWHESVEDIIAEGDRVVIRIHSTGTQSGVFNGIAPTGKKIAIEEIHIFRLDHGRIAEQWGMPDVHSLMQQLGASGSEPMKAQASSSRR